MDRRCTLSCCWACGLWGAAWLPKVEGCVAAAEEGGVLWGCIHGDFGVCEESAICAQKARGEVWLRFLLARPTDRIRW